MATTFKLFCFREKVDDLQFFPIIFAFPSKLGTRSTDTHVFGQMCFPHNPSSLVFVRRVCKKVSFSRIMFMLQTFLHFFFRITGSRADFCLFPLRRACSSKGFFFMEAALIYTKRRNTLSAASFPPSDPPFS